MSRARQSKPLAAPPPEIPAFHAVSFADVADAVEFCHRLVPFVVPRVGGLSEEESRAVVWFHVPVRAHRSTNAGCALYLSEGAMQAARRCGLACVIVAEIARRALPETSVLVFGEDGLPPERLMVAEESRTAVGSSRLRSMESKRTEADAILL